MKAMALLYALTAYLLDSMQVLEIVLLGRKDLLRDELANFLIASNSFRRIKLMARKDTVRAVIYHQEVSLSCPEKN
jgi:hypothetical protein